MNNKLNVDIINKLIAFNKGVEKIQNPSPELIVAIAQMQNAILELLADSSFYTTAK